MVQRCDITPRVAFQMGPHGIKRRLYIVRIPGSRIEWWVSLWNGGVEGRFSRKDGKECRREANEQQHAAALQAAREARDLSNKKGG